MLCFLLPLFTVSSCSDDGGTPSAQASATGVDVLLGRTIHAHPTNQASATVQAEAQSISHAVRPWAIVTLILCGAGIALNIRVRRYHRLVNAGLSAATLLAVITMWQTVTSPTVGSDPDIGLALALFVLLLSTGLQVCLFTWLGLRHALRSRSDPTDESKRGPPGARE
jgi:hypothetical protein